MLLLNLDETSIPIGPDAKRKSNMISATTRRETPRHLIQCTYQAKETQRAHFTHVAIVCDNTELQPLLPQVLIFNMKQLLRKEQQRFGS